MKFIKEKLYEKFEPESDPVKDMGIGDITIEKHIDKVLKNTDIDKDSSDFFEYFYETLYEQVDKRDLIEMLINLVDTIPIEKQIEYYQGYVENFIEEN